MDLQPLAVKPVAALIPTLPMPIPMPKVARTTGWQAYCRPLPADQGRSGLLRL